VHNLKHRSALVSSTCLSRQDCDCAKITECLTGCQVSNAVRENTYFDPSASCVEPFSSVTASWTNSFSSVNNRTCVFGQGVPVCREKT